MDLLLQLKHAVRLLLLYVIVKHKRQVIQKRCLLHPSVTLQTLYIDLHSIQRAEHTTNR